ncbi:cysteine-rich repeat secretory protein 11-like [Cynara cardunculus var. scolymus]|uniref:cysteine-rich repeat secretory protein 11-like n=1 Tax=Cynara cardunculus var. scolymus TaxID=59895 RepID=UPI000D62862C|nr:cysteine-rich repeat secretory protein 11-like [Cynara cardunculus var. scolymus]
MASQPTKPIFFLLVIFLFSPSSSFAGLTDFMYKGCANQKFQDPSGISSQNLKSLYTTLISQSSTTNFYKTTVGGNDSSSTTAITGLYQCRGDLSNTDCNTCVNKIPETIGKLCGGDTIAARVQLDGCYLRYEVVGFPPATATDVLFKQCGSNRASGSGFDDRLESALSQIEKGVVTGKGYYAGEYQSVYVLGQCEGDLGNGECVNCVKTAAENGRSSCGSSISGRIYLQQCYISYTYYPNGVPGSGTGGGGGGIATGATETGGGGRRHDTQKLVAIVIGGLAGLFLGIAFLMVLRSAFKKKKEKYSYGGY